MSSLQSKTNQIKVITCGFSRCGTVSMKYALERLGFGQCTHMIDGAQRKRPYNDAIYWFYGLEKRIKNAELIEWDDFFNQLPEYHSCSDWPTSLYWEELAEYYPNAKIILTVRDDPNKWHESLVFAFQAFTNNKIAKLLSKLHKGYDMLFNQWFPKYFDRFEDGMKGFFENKNNTAINYYHKHIKYVQSKISKDRLLIFNFKDGYKPLCKFLNVDVPIDPTTGKVEEYPRKNDRNELTRIVKESVRKEALKWVTIFSIICVVGLAVYSKVKTKKVNIYDN